MFPLLLPFLFILADLEQQEKHKGKNQPASVLEAFVCAIKGVQEGDNCNCPHPEGPLGVKNPRDGGEEG